MFVKWIHKIFTTLILYVVLHVLYLSNKSKYFIIENSNLQKKFSHRGQNCFVQFNPLKILLSAIIIMVMYLKWEKSAFHLITANGQKTWIMYPNCPPMNLPQTDIDSAIFPWTQEVFLVLFFRSARCNQALNLL